VAKIVITEFMDQPAVDSLSADFDVVYDTALWARRADLETAAGDAHALIVRNRTQVDASLMDQSPKLKVIGRLGVGLDNIDTAHAKARNIAVAPAVGANAVSVAEYVIGTALVLLRGAYYASADLAAGRWPREVLGKGREAAGATMGIVGFGSIGQIVADKARAMGFHVIAADDYLPADAAAWSLAERVDLATLIRRADVVSLHCPLTPETRGLIDAGRLAEMKQGSVLINTARGGVVDEAALAEALRSGHLGGAAVDVFTAEPIDMATGALFAGLSNVILTPHIAGVTAEANTRISTITAANVRRVLGVQS
jgi:(S)-sulfolactate dehydrogenase